MADTAAPPASDQTGTGAPRADLGARLARGVARALSEQGFVSLAEFRTPEGRRMDLMALGPKGELWCIEVKSSRADFMTDAKWERYLPYCDRFFFAVPDGFPDELLPAGEGMMRADAWGAEVLREAPERPVEPARRRSLTLAFARLAAQRLAAAGTGPAMAPQAPID